MSKPALKPCPFCGSDDLDFMETDSGIAGLKGWYYVTCWCCNAESGRGSTKKKASEAWNERYDKKSEYGQ